MNYFGRPRIFGDALGLLRGGGAGGDPEILLLDDFLNLTEIDTAGVMTVNAGSAVIAGTPNSNHGDPALYETDSRAREIGLAVLHEFNADFQRFVYFGFNDQIAMPSGSPLFIVGAGYQQPSNLWQLRGAAINGPLTFAASTTYQLVTVLRNPGFLVYIKGGAYTAWRLLGVHSAGTETPVYAAFADRNNTGTLSKFRVAQLTGDFASQYGPATQALTGAVSEAADYTHEGNTFIEFVATTLPSAGNIQVVFRQQDVNNKWYVQINSSGDLELYDVVGGSATQRAVVAGVVTAGNRILITALANSINVFNNTGSAAITFTSASFQTETAGTLLSLGTGGVVSELVAWPSVLPTALASQLDFVADAT